MKLERPKTAFYQPHRTSPHNGSSLNILAILDDFSSLSFSDGANLWRLSPDDVGIDEPLVKPDFLLVESAWAGNFDTWKFKVTTKNGPAPVLKTLVKRCKALGIPTVFWNKEDPPHFEDFIETAKLFDHIFTTEESKIGEYYARTEASSVDLLRFAANPAIHNPAWVEDYRAGDIAFAGMYFKHKYPERRKQIDQLFPPATNYKFEIYSRHAGGDSRYQFPEPFDSYIVGRLPYEEMVRAYRKYKIFLNLNSVPNSKSMCARRVFELSAAKTAVVGMHSDAIRSIYDESEVLLANDESEVREIYEFLLGDELGRRRLTQRAWRKTLSTHTYRYRIAQMAKTVGIEIPDQPVRIVLMLDKVKSYEHASKILGQAYNQRFTFPREVKFGWFLSSETRTMLTMSEIVDLENSFGPQIVGDLAGCHIVYINAEFELGTFYLNDLLLMSEQMKTDFVAKSIGSLETVRETEERFSSSLPPHGWMSGIIGSRDVSELIAQENAINVGGKAPTVYVGDPFGIAKFQLGETSPLLSG
ncbi:CgeB family protein [Corynebacterium phocae]|uniref:CgeB family protein n=1 Tax=Corynebacterium phocae TaxID=161895 RepID=UPI000952A87C|nr:glycosyltransferase [Corynebacterium phocae]